MCIRDRLRKGRLIGTVPVSSVSVEEMSEMMVGRKVDLNFELGTPKLGDRVLRVRDLTIDNTLAGQKELKGLNFDVRAGEIVCIAGIDGNGQSELVESLSGLIDNYTGTIELNNEDISKKNIRFRNTHGLSHIPEDRHKHGLILDYDLQKNMVLQQYFEPSFQNGGFIKFDEVRNYSKVLIDQYDVRAGKGPDTITRSMSGGNQQKAIVAREIERPHDLLIAVQPTRGLDVGAIEYIHSRLIDDRNNGKGVLLISFELNEVLGISDRILVMYEGQIVAEVTPSTTTEQELGLYMSGAKRMEVKVND